MKTFKFSVCLLLTTLIPRFGFADLVGPYTPDTNTLFLLHFDEAAGGSVTTNVGLKAGNFYSVNENPASTAPPTVTTMLGAAGYVNGATNFNNCMTNPTSGYVFGYDFNKSGAYDGEQNTANPSADRLALTNLNIGLGSQSPFTLEALIRPTTTAGNQEIICTDTDGWPVGNNTNRGFQFRITVGSLQFQMVGGPNPPGPTAVSGNLLTLTGPDAFVAGTWYHVAMVYDGAKATLYWTKLDPSVGAAHVLGSPVAMAIGTPIGAIQTPLNIGSDNRDVSGEQFVGCIDEVRISSVARAANQMQFFSPLVSITQNPVSQNVDYNQPVTFSVSASSLTPLGYQWRFNSNSIAGGTNTSYVITNVAAANAGYYDVVVTNTAGYAATSSPPALLIVGAANFLNHRYSFNSDTLTNDSIGGATGTNFGTATVTGGQLVLDGSSGCYMQLPGNLFNGANATALTVEFWANYGVNANNAYVFGFGYTNFVIGSGIVAVNYVTYSPHNANGQGLLISPSDPTFQQSVTASNTLDGLTWHVACVIDPPNQTLAIYTNGVLEAVNTNMTVNLANVHDTLSFIGRSLFAADPYLNASIDELRIYNGALAGLSIQQSDNQGPNTVLADGPAKFVVQPTSTSVAAGQTASFTAGAAGYLPITYQWFKNGTLVPGATNTSYSFAAVIGDNNASIICYATNTIGVTTYVTNSLTATLTVRVPLNLTWAGTGANWDITSLNWTTNANVSQAAYTEADNVTFDNLGSAQPTVNLTSTFHPSSVTASGTASYTLNGVGSITGSASLTKNGAGTLVIDTTNSYAGLTTISGGILQLGDGTTTGTIGTNAVVNNAAVVVSPGGSASVTLSGPISGSGSLTLNTVSGAAVLSGSNSYSGGTTVSAGSLHPRNSSALGNGSTVVSGSGAQVYADVNVDLNPQPLTLNGSGITSDGALRKGGAGTTSFGGTVTLGSDTTIGVDGGATLNLTNAFGINGASANANLTLAGSGAGNVTGPLSLGTGNLTVGGGTWTVAPSNSYSGLTTINGGALFITGPLSLSQPPVSFNASQVTLNGGALGGATNITLNDGKIGITLTANSTISVNTNSTLTISNDISGSASLFLTKTGPGTLVLNGANDFFGTLNVDSGSTTANDGTTVIANNAAIANILLVPGTPFIYIRNNNNGSSTLALDGTLGSITVAPDISLAGRNNTVPAIENIAGNNTISGNFTLVVGGGYILQSDSGTLTLTQPWPFAPPPNVTTARVLTLTGAGIISMAGVIQDGSLLGTNVPVSVLKSGSGILNLPVANTYSGTTVVSNGVLSLTGSIGTNTATVAGGLLVGTGIIAGPVTVESGGAIEAGTTNTIGTLHLSSTLALSGNTVVKINKNAGTQDLFSGQSSVTYGGTLTVTNLAGTLALGNSFTLFSPGVSASNFASIIGSPGAGLAYRFTNGVLSVVVGVASNPTNIWFKVSGNTLTLSWPADHLGWILQSQTNSLSTGLSTNWHDVVGSDSSNTNVIPINATNPTVFYRLRLP